MKFGRGEYRIDNRVTTFVHSRGGKAVAFVLVALLATLTFVPLQARASATVIFLTSGTSWTVPSDWNSSNNTIEVIGGGGSGGVTMSLSAIALATGGGGGAYSKISNLTLTPGATVTYQIGSGGASSSRSTNGATNGAAGGDTFFNRTAGSTGTCADTVSVCAKGGNGGQARTTNAPPTLSGGAGGSADNGVGTTKYSGGAGGNLQSTAGGSYATGAGGAAGPNGAGNAGVTSTSNAVALTNGGSGDAGAGGTAGVISGGVGGAGTEWDAAHGSGGGGASNGGGAVTAGSGGLYGAGGAGVSNGALSGSPIISGAGARGIIVITYTPAPTPKTITFTGNVKFIGNLLITGALSKSSGTFVIDHPQKPKTHLLYHSFVESPEAKNIYDGIATLDENGEARIFLPEYFEALNGEFRYQWLAMYQPMPGLYIKEEVHDNQFVIAGGPPGGEVSWQITGVRHDPYIQHNPIQVEVDKGPGQPVRRGECLYEPLCE